MILLLCWGWIGTVIEPRPEILPRFDRVNVLNELVDHIPDVDALCGQKLLKLGGSHGSQGAQAGGQLHIAEGADCALEDGGLKRMGGRYRMR